MKNVKLNKKLLYNSLYVIINFLIFFSVDVFIRLVAIDISNYENITMFAPNMFTFLYFLIFTALIYMLPKVYSYVLAIFIYINTILIFLIHYFLLKIKGEAFAIYNLQNTSEGAKYINFIYNKLNIGLVFYAIILIFLCVISILLIKKINEGYKYKYPIYVYFIFFVVIMSLLFFPSHTLKYSDNEWENVDLPKYYYINMNNPKKSLVVMGLYEYSLKDFINYIKITTSTYGSTKEIQALQKKYSVKKEKNDYTGIFKNKNLIMIMMESVDYISIDKKSTPTLYKLLNEGWTFPERYSSLSTGGSTILTEYASLTGLIYNQAYNNRILTNTYNESIPIMFSQNGYTTSFFHENSGKYYNRNKLHSSIGFDNMYFLYDMYPNMNYDCSSVSDAKADTAYVSCDSQFVNNKDLYKKLVNKNGKFMSFIVTISAHGPYDNTNTLCPDSADNQVECLKYLSGKTDKLIEDLLKNLQKDKLLDDTVIVLFTDHQAYSLDYPEKYLKNLKTIDTDKNIKAIPFIIYNSNMKHKKFNDILVNDIDIVPTLLNMFGIDYDPNIYIGNDLFSSNRKNLILFSDGEWYNGKVYSGNKKKVVKDEEYKNNTMYVKDILKLNDMIISNNYYSSKK